MEKSPYIGGVYRAYDASGKHDTCFVGFSFNIASSVKRLRFELALNACSYTPLQAFWNQCGELTFETLQSFEAEDVVTLERQYELEALARSWCMRLGSTAQSIQSEVRV